MNKIQSQGRINVYQSQQTKQEEQEKTVAQSFSEKYQEVYRYRELFESKLSYVDSYNKLESISFSAPEEESMLQDLNTCYRQYKSTVQEAKDMSIQSRVQRASSEDNFFTLNVRQAELNLLLEEFGKQDDLEKAFQEVKQRLEQSSKSNPTAQSNRSNTTMVTSGDVATALSEGIQRTLSPVKKKAIEIFTAVEQQNKSQASDKTPHREKTLKALTDSYCQYKNEYKQAKFQTDF
ncbi:MAG: hypothetical protein AAGJ35_01015, partial [Myxococcota bacterium]